MNQSKVFYLIALGFPWPQPSEAFLHPFPPLGALSLLCVHDCCTSFTQKLLQQKIKKNINQSINQLITWVTYRADLPSAKNSVFQIVSPSVFCPKRKEAYVVQGSQSCLYFLVVCLPSIGSCSSS